MQKLFILTTILLVFSACDSYKVNQTYDKNTDFNQYQTFSFHPWDDENSSIVNRFDQERIISSISKELKSKGYTHVNDQGDLIVDIFIILDKKQGTTAYTSHYGSPYWGGYGFYGYGYGYSTGYYSTAVGTYNYIQGTAIINLFDRSEKKLVWQGTGVGVVSPDRNERNTSIPKSVGKIFFHFPKKKKKK